MTGVADGSNRCRGNRQTYHRVDRRWERGRGRKDHERRSAVLRRDPSCNRRVRWRAIVAPPDLESDFIRLICQDFTAPHMWDVEADLWTEKEGRSELSIRVRVYEDPERIEISDILVP